MANVMDAEVTHAPTRPLIVCEMAVTEKLDPDYGCVLQDLLGREVVAVHLSRDNTLIMFELRAGEPLWFYTDGDCCSSSWIEHLNGIDALLRSPVQSVLEPVNVDDGIVDEGDDREDTVRVYHEGVRTLRGDFVVEFRNGSNGYYGGSLRRRSSHAPVLMRNVTEDF